MPDTDFIREQKPIKCGTPEGLIDVLPVRERQQVVPVAEIRGVYPPEGDWTPDLELKGDVPPDRRQRHEANLREAREHCANPTRRVKFDLSDIPLEQRQSLRSDYLQFVATKGGFLVMGAGVYWVKVAREQGLSHIIALVREKADNPPQ